MAFPQTAPCVNINDDVVQVVSIKVRPGDFVKAGDLVGEVETDKSLVDVVSEQEGFVLKVLCKPQQKVRVGSVMFWLGATIDEPAPEDAASAPVAATAAGKPTAKARAMLKELGLDASGIPSSGERLTVADIEAWLEASGSGHRPRAASPGSPTREPPLPDVPGTLEELSVEAAGMLHTVEWHRDHAASAYLELEYDPKPWEAYAKRHADQHKLMLSPLLPLMAWRLVQLGREKPTINATVHEGRRYAYQSVNLGFTVQVGQTLYLTVVREAQNMDAPRFIDALGEVQRHAMAHKLRPEESTGATLSFSSMSRWNVSRHIPILPPHSSLIVAHVTPKHSGHAVLGATYDHRLLSGFDVAQVLQALSKPLP